ncbi:hypothetical protein pb186bvf_018661 [Paramecium bursaria]
MKTLVLLVLATAVFGMTETEYIQQIHRIDATQFGRTLFDTIWLQLEAGDPLDRLLQTLHDLEDRYFAEQKEDDAANRDFQDACNVDIAFYDKELALANKDKIGYEAKLEGDLYPRRSILQGLVAAKKAEVKGYQKEIDELDEERAEAKAEYESIVEDHNVAIAVLTEARNLIKSNVEASFVQVNGKKITKSTLSKENTLLLTKHIKESHRRITKTKHMQRYGPIFKLLAQITSKAKIEDETLERVVGLFDRLISEVEDSLSLQRFSEDKRVEAYNKSRYLLVRSLNVANSQLANSESELSSLNDQIFQTETSLDNTNVRIDNLTERRLDRWTQCEEAAKDYQDSRAARDSDRQVVSDTIGLVNAALRTLREQLALRQAAGDNI